MSDRNSTGPEALPQVAEMDYIVSRAYTSSNRETNIISVEVQLLNPVEFPRNDGQEPRSAPQHYEVECFRDRSPAAFEALINAPLGAKVSIIGRLRSQRARVAGRNDSSWSKRLGLIEATDAKVKQVLVDVDTAQAAQV